MMKSYSFLICLLLLTGTAIAQKHYVLVLSKTVGKVIVLDYKTLDSITAIPVGPDPHEVVVTPDGSKAYVSVPLMNAGGHTIDVLDLKTLTRQKTIDTSPFLIPHGMAYVNNQLWFTAQGSKNVVVYEPETDKMVSAFGTGQDFTHLLHVTPNGSSFYTTNVESGTLSIYRKKEIPPYMPPTGVLPPNAKNRVEWRQHLLNVGVGSEGFDVTADGKELWTARPDGTVVVVNLEKEIITAQFDSGVKGLHRLKITPDGKTVCMVSVKTGELLYYDRLSRKLIKEEKIGRGAGIYMDKESNRMFISCTPDNEVVVVDLSSGKTIKRMKTGRPDAITAVVVQ